ncbi:PH domain-containing protein [Candidatus Roizmanbacteria bacterium]|nr:PH domain-containing protein [Candidatus Roizmanbacteria bacterium]
MDEQFETSHQLFHSFCIRPDFSFEIQGKDEEVILVLRQHPIVALNWFFNVILFLILLVIVNLVFAGLLNPQQQFFTNFLTVALILSYFWFNLVTYHFNVGIVTNKRVIDLDFQIFGLREFTIADLGRIEDITTKSAGFFQSLFNYGDVFIQTAGTEANVEYHRVPKPTEVTSIINKLIEK